MEEYDGNIENYAFEKAEEITREEFEEERDDIEYACKKQYNIAEAVATTVVSTGLIGSIIKVIIDKIREKPKKVVDFATCAGISVAQPVAAGIATWGGFKILKSIGSTIIGGIGTVVGGVFGGIAAGISALLSIF